MSHSKSMLLICAAVGTLAVDPAGGQEIDLTAMSADKGIAISGTTASSVPGRTVAPLGDINNDGYDDFVIGDPGHFFSGPSGRAFVVFGKPGSFNNLDVASISSANSNGFKITTSHYAANLGFSCASAGDFNNDGFDDIIVAAPNHPVSGRSMAGAVYVIFGKATGFADLTDETIASNNAIGFRISGPNGAKLGNSVAGAGDMNGDGFDDILIGAPGTASAYVIFGKAGSQGNIDLASFSSSDTTGFRLTGTNNMGWYVSPAGDFNSDGLADIIISGLSNSTVNGELVASYLIFGKESGYQNVSLSSFPAQPSDGVRILTASALGSETSVGSAGDFNNDGFDDVVAGTRYATVEGRESSGAAFVLWGRNDNPVTVSLAAITAPDQNGMRIYGASGQAIGSYPTTGGDINNDGISDLVIDAPGATYGGSKGYVYGIYGKAFPVTDIDLSAISSDSSSGFRLETNQLDLPRPNACAAGDVDGDGYGDILVGWAKRGANNMLEGQTYLLFGDSLENAGIADWSQWE